MQNTMTKTKLDLCKWILVECWAFEREIWFADKVSSQVMWPEGFLSSSLSVYKNHQSIEIFTLKNKTTQLSDLFISKELGEISSIKKASFSHAKCPVSLAILKATNKSLISTSEWTRLRIDCVMLKLRVDRWIYHC